MLQFLLAVFGILGMFGGLFLHLKGVISRKEFYGLMFLGCVAGMLSDLLWLLQDPTAIGPYFGVAWMSYLSWSWYKAWKKAGDDDDFRKRRRERVHNKLKKFEIKRIPQPVVVRGW